MPSRARSNGPDWLAGASKMAAFIRHMAWERTPLGALDTWPQSLRTSVSLCLASSFPISIAWGKHFTQIYNDGYWPICGAKHPTSMGQDFRECWAAPWSVIGEAFDQAVRGQTSFLENQRMFLDRNGYIEETCFTFSFSPIRDETGGVGGLFHPVIETTAAMLAARRSRALRELSALSGRALDVEDAFASCLKTLREDAFDVPFVALYFASDGGMPRAVGSTGLPAQGLPEHFAWPLQSAMAAQSMMVLEHLPESYARICCAPYEEPLQRAVLLPLRVPGCTGVLVAGASPRLPFDEIYQGFMEMLAGGISAVISSARTHQQERQRAEELAVLDRAKTAFFSNVSHEFRTPLTLILGPAEDLLHGAWGALQPPQQQQLQVLHRNALRLLRLVNSLLDFSRIEANRAQAAFAAVDLAAITTDLASAFRAAIERAGMQLQVHCAPLPDDVYVDRDMWEKIVLNLLSNAFKYTLEGSICVRQYVEGSDVVLQVQDTGIGIPADEVAHVFERFHRVQGVQGRTHEGTGIGLALVRELVRLHGGTVSLQSIQGEGSTFTVRFPLGDTHLPQGARDAKSALQSTAVHADAFVEEALRWLPPQEDAAPADAEEPMPTGPRKQVLVADDNADMRAYVARLLQVRYDVVAVSNGQEALHQALESRPDLILSDVMMPVMDGFELLQAVRAHAALHTVPFILVSARAGDEARSEGIESGADDYLTKPFSARELVARVHTQLTLAQTRVQAKEREMMAAHVTELQHHIAKRDEFLCVASHELKTPLTSLMLQVQSMRRRMRQEGYEALTPERVQRVVESTDLQVGRMARLVDDMLDASRLDTGMLRLHRDAFPLTDLVHTVLERMRGQIEDAQVEVQVAVQAPTDLEVQWDRFRVEQVLINLLTNALRYGDKKPVDIIAESHDDRARITVRDHGRGIAVADQGRIFERFERATAASEVSGLGLGLYIAARIVGMHGGTLTVESAPGTGAAFCFEMPRRLQ